MLNKKQVQVLSRNLNEPKSVQKPQEKNRVRGAVITKESETI